MTAAIQSERNNGSRNGAQAASARLMPTDAALGIVTCSAIDLQFIYFSLRHVVATVFSLKSQSGSALRHRCRPIAERPVSRSPGANHVDQDSRQQDDDRVAYFPQCVLALE